jgi:hypothetical protein
MPLPDIDSAVAIGANAWMDAEPVVDPTTELPAATMKTIAANATAITHTATRACVLFQCATYTSGDQAITVLDHDAVWGNHESVAPTVVQSESAGAYVITWPETVTDELGNTHVVNCRFPRVHLYTYVHNAYAMVSVFTANTIRVSAHLADSYSSLNGARILVEWS